MRFRFFLTTLFVLLAVSLGTVVIHGYFLRADRMNLVDQQVRQTAAALVDSELNDLRKINFEAAEDIISDELGESRFGKFFIIRNSRGNVIYKSSGVYVLKVSELPRSPQWLRIERAGQLIRVLNLQLPRVNDRTLQVGVVVDRNYVEFNYLSLSSLMVFVTVFAVGLLVSSLVSFFLMRPISRLESFLSSAVKDQVMYLPQLSAEITKGASLDSRDEFRRLVFGLSEMIEKVNRNYRSSRLWSYQMAHELKTPLTLMNLQSEKLERKTGASPEVESIRQEIQKMTGTIQGFLSWAELENSQQQRHLFANKLSRIIESEAARLSAIYSNRVVVEIKSELTVLSNPQHLEQLVHNLVINALEYSPSSKQVIIAVSKQGLRVSDCGGGIPDDVLARVGEPFNLGKRGGTGEREGHGLGLAWVKTICRLYGWILEIDSKPSGTDVTVSFELESVNEP